MLLLCCSSCIVLQVFNLSTNNDRDMFFLVYHVVHGATLRVFLLQVILLFEARKIG